MHKHHTSSMQAKNMQNKQKNQHTYETKTTHAYEEKPQYADGNTTNLHTKHTIRRNTERTPTNI